MKPNVRYALITAFAGKMKDRFHEYNEDLTFPQKLNLVTQMKGMSGVEVIFPYEVHDARALKTLLEKHKFTVAAVNVNVKAEPEFRNGGLTSKDAGIRNKAVRFIKEAKDFAQNVGADKVTCCPLGDGYEFAFQCDYARMWRYLAETLGEAGDYKKEIPLFIEYKPSETRGHCFLDTAAKTLCLLNDLGIKQMGVTMDYGHSKYGQENPAEVVAMLAGSPYPFYIHINDNNGRWDWDFMVASDNYLEYVEFLYYLQEFGYRDFLTSDTSPTRWDIVGTFEANIRMTQKIWNRLLEINRPKFKKLIHGGDFLATWKFLEKNIFAL